VIGHIPKIQNRTQKRKNKEVTTCGLKVKEENIQNYDSEQFMHK